MLKKCLLILILSQLILFCEKQPKNKSDIVVSISPQKYFIDRISNNTIPVHVISPDRENPYSHTISQKMANHIKKSYVYIMIGNVSFEDRNCKEIKKINPEIKIINLSQAINLQPFPEEHIKNNDDKFVWLSPETVKTMLTILTETLSDKNPHLQNVYEKNMNTFIEEINNFDYSAKAIFRDTIKKDFLTNRPFWTYFAHHYRLTQIALNDSKTTDTTKKKKLITNIKNKKIKAIITSRYPENSIPDDISSQIDSQSFEIDPFDYDWMENMHAIVSTFKDALNY